MRPPAHPPGAARATARRWYPLPALLALLVGPYLGAGCESHEAAPPVAASGPTGALDEPTSGLVPSVEVNSRLLRRFAPLRAVVAADPATITEPVTTLGRMLFFDPRLS